MKKRALSLLMAFIMVVGLLPTAAWAAGTTFDDYFVKASLPATATNYSGYNKWKVITKDGEEVLKNGSLYSRGDNYFTLTFTEDTHLSFEYKVSSGSNYNYFSLSQNDTELTAEGSKYGNNVDWTLYTLDVQKNDILKFGYKKTADYVAKKLDDCVYLRNFACAPPFVVTFHANGGTGADYTQNIYGGTGTLMANTFTNPGKVFAGWATSAGGAVVYADGATIATIENVTSDFDLYAVWGDACTVTFDYNDSKTNNATVYIAQNTAIGTKIPADPKKTGYIFAGWFNGGEKLTADTIISSDVTYTAKWTPIRYIIVLNPGDGVGEKVTLDAVYDKEIKLPVNTFTRDGYDFAGWSEWKSSASGSIQDGATISNKTATNGATYNLYAAWKGKKVKVTLDFNYKGAEPIERTGSVGSNFNYDNGKLSSIETQKRTGYLFDGWFDAAEGGKQITNQDKFTAEDAGKGVTLYAHWTKGITVHFDGNGYTKDIADETVKPDQVSSSLPYLSDYYYPANKALDGWYIKNADGSFGEAVTKDTKFDGDEVTLIAKWRDYQYIIKFNIKSADKSSVNGTMADQPAPFGKDVKLSKCAFTREGYDFAGWATSSNGSVKYQDEATIKREWDDGDYWYDGSEYKEPFNLYAVWTENKSPAQTEAEAKLAAAERAISGTYNCTYGTDTNALTMVRAKLTAADITDVSVSVKEEYNFNYVGISADGELRYKWNDNGSTTAAAGSIRPILMLTYNETYTKESDECLFSMGLDEKKAAAALNAVAERIGASLPSTIEKTEDLTALPKYPLKAGVNADGVDYKSSADLELWTTANWEEKSGKLTIESVGYPAFSPYKVTVTQDKEKDVLLTLTLTLVYNGREDLKVTRDFPINIKRGDAGGIDYQAALEGALSGVGLKDFVTGEKLTADANGVYTTSNDIQFPITGDLNRYMLDKYGEGHGFDGKYTPVLITSDNPDVIKAPDVANAARVAVYRPAVGKEAKTVTLTVKILDRSSGEGRDYASMPVLAEKTFRIVVKPLTQDEIDAEKELMKLVKDAYWDGIRNGNSDPEDVTTDLAPFVEVYKENGALVWVRDVRKMRNSGIVPVAMKGWQELEAWRLFRSSNPAAVTHENLLVTQQFEGKAVTVTSALSSETLGRYGELYRNDPKAYADYKACDGLYYQPVSAKLVVRGRNTAHMVEKKIMVNGWPETRLVSKAVEEKVTVSFTLSGNGELWLGTRMIRDLDEGVTVFDVLRQLRKGGVLSFEHKGGYVQSITCGGKTLAELDEGKNSGWLYTVNGELPDVYMSAYGLKNGDSIRIYFTKDYTKEPGADRWKPVTPVTKTETVTNADGSTTKTETKSDGTVIETTTWRDGSTLTAETSPNGRVETVEKRADGTTVETVEPVSGEITASVSVPKSVGSTRVDIPVSKPTGSMVAVIVHPDGTEEIVRGSVVTETGVALRAEGDVRLKIIDNAKRFNDMADHWAKDAVEFASSRELFNGVGNDAFGPDRSMTRGMVGTVLARLARADTAGGETWYAKGTVWAVENGISDGTAPEQPVTREQLAAMLYRYAGSPAVSGELGFDDADSISAWARDAVRWCVDNGILNGVGGNRMTPQDLARRGQVAAMLMRFLQATV